MSKGERSRSRAQRMPLGATMLGMVRLTDEDRALLRLKRDLRLSAAPEVKAPVEEPGDREATGLDFRGG